MKKTKKPKKDTSEIDELREESRNMKKNIPGGGDRRDVKRAKPEPEPEPEPVVEAEEPEDDESS